MCVAIVLIVLQDSSKFFRWPYSEVDHLSAYTYINSRLIGSWSEFPRWHCSICSELSNYPIKRLVIPYFWYSGITCITKRKGERRNGNFLTYQSFLGILSASKWSLKSMRSMQFTPLSRDCGWRVPLQLKPLCVMFILCYVWLWNPNKLCTIWKSKTECPKSLSWHLSIFSCRLYSALFHNDHFSVIRIQCTCTFWALFWAHFSRLCSYIPGTVNMTEL